MKTQHILVIDRYFIKPDFDSGSLRMFEILKGLCELGKKVTFIPQDLDLNSAYRDLLEEHGIKVPSPAEVPSIQKYLERFGKQFYSIILSRGPTAGDLIKDVKRLCPKALLVFDTVDLGFLRLERQHQFNPTPTSAQTAHDLKKTETRIVETCDVTLAISDHEKRMIHSLNRKTKRARVEVISNIHRVQDEPFRAPKFSDRRGIFFVGNFHHQPNVDAMYYFMDSIWPVIHNLDPSIPFYLAGSSAPTEMEMLATETDGIHFLGYIPDLRPVYSRVRVSISPLRIGAGVKGKVNQAMSFGVPTVATSIAAEGIPCRPGTDILVYDKPAEFAAAVVKLHQDETLWNALAQASIKNIENHFTPKIAIQTLSQIFQS